MPFHLRARPGIGWPDRTGCHGVRACIFGSPFRPGHLSSGVLLEGLAADPVVAAVASSGAMEARCLEALRFKVQSIAVHCMLSAVVLSWHMGADPQANAQDLLRKLTPQEATGGDGTCSTASPAEIRDRVKDR